MVLLGHELLLHVLPPHRAQGNGPLTWTRTSETVSQNKPFHPLTIQGTSLHWSQNTHHVSKALCVPFIYSLIHSFIYSFIQQNRNRHGSVSHLSASSQASHVWSVSHLSASMDSTICLTRMPGLTYEKMPDTSAQGLTDTSMQ